MEIIVDFIWYLIDLFTTKIADYIKLKDLEKRLKL